MPGLTIGKKEEQVSNLNIANFIDDPTLKLKQGHSCRSRHTRWVRSIIVHNTKNIPVVIKPGKGPSTNVGKRVVNWWSLNPTPAGAHIIIDWDGVIYCLTDLLEDAAYHASKMNENSIGIEVYENDQGVVYEAQVNALVELVVWLCHRFNIQMQMPVYDNKQIDRLVSGGNDCVGVFGHCHVWYQGKKYDPSINIFKALMNTNLFKQFDFQNKKDLEFWEDIQFKLHLKVDGVPGPKTSDALQELGYKSGLYDWKGVIT